jgi:hypothetical protein
LPARRQLGAKSLAIALLEPLSAATVDVPNDFGKLHLYLLLAPTKKMN